MELSGGEIIRPVERPMDDRVLWVYNSIFFANCASDLTLFQFGTRVHYNGEWGVIESSPVCRNDSLHFLTAKFRRGMAI